MRFGSVCSGIEAASVAWHPLGWSTQWVSEVDPFACAVLAHRFPTVPNLGDMTRIVDAPAIDLLVGGTPCQSFSIAGLRGGLGDDRGNLALVFCRLAATLRPRWVLWENVPGVLSSNGGRDFGSILGALGHLGYGFAYRVLDAQFFGVPQRRRRVFVVGHLGDWRPAAAVLFERESLRGNPPARRAQGEEVAGTLGGGSGSRGWAPDTDRMTFVPEVAKALTTSAQRLDSETETLLAQLPSSVKAQSVALRGRDGGATAELGDDRAFALRAAQGGGSMPHVLAFHHTQDPISGDVSPCLSKTTDGMGVCITGDVTHTPRAEGFDAGEDGTGRGQPITPVGARVRRLTPRECERLQGFPDDWTLVPYRGKPAADGPRYKACGNSMAVPVMRWIGERIELVDAALSQSEAA